MNHLKHLSVFLLVLGAACAAARGQEETARYWPQWRGPRLDGHSAQTQVPVQWSATENVAWKVAIPGKGHSSPIVWGERIFLTTCLEKEGKRLVLCLNRGDGRMLWQKEVFSAPLEKKHSLNGYATATPATDGKHVWATFLKAPEVVVVCYDLEGNEVWRKSPGKFFSMHGWGVGPILYKDMVIVNCDQDAQAYIVAMDKETGREVWRIDRPNRVRSYCVPAIFQAAGKMQMVLTGSKSVASYDPDTGRQHWVIDGPTDQFVASPVFADGVFFITGGFPTFHIMGIRPDGEGNVTETHVLWHHKQGASYVPSPIAFDKYFVVVSDEGLATCLEARTGRRMWSQQLGKHHRPSPVCADGRLYFLADNGDMFVLKAAPQFERIGVNAIGENCFASPAIAPGQMFIRGVDSLWCIKTGEAK